ncbi:MAG: 3-deoxy-D-manno-octulosonic acid transferase [Thermodesulfovibrionaceae bacterium]
MQKSFLYSLIYLLVLMFFLPKEYFKRPKDLRRRWIKEKFGFFDYPAQSFKPKIWIHAVSVGEVLAVANFIKKLSENYDIVLSTITDTGQKVAYERFKSFPVKIIYLPLDIPFVIKRVLKFLNPVALFLTETEIWPNLIKYASQRIPVFLINGRISEKSFEGYRKIRFFIKEILNSIKLFCVQEEEYKKRLIALGVSEEKIYVTGNMKFDLKIERLEFPWEKSLPKPIVLAGSTHEPEETIILDAFLKLDIPSTLIVAPRHPERFNEVEKLIKEYIKNREDIFFSKISDLSESLVEKSRLIVLVDKIGILASLYRVCDVAIVGGSFIPHGGQNPLEPAYWRKPIVCGPYMFNFPFIEEFVKEEGCLIVDDKALFSVLKELIENQEKKNKVGENAYRVFSKKSGATDKTIDLVMRSLLQYFQVN